MPKIHLIEDDSLNAFASGLSDKTFAVTLSRGIINKLEELQLASADYEPIKKFYDIMFNYIRTGQRTILNIPFPEINKRVGPT